MSKAEPLRLRAAHTSEAREIASISRQQVEYGLNWRWTPARVKRYIADPESMVLVASRGGVIQGFAIMKFADDAAHLLLLAVQPKARREGVGTELLAWLEKSCDTAGMQQIRLEVRSSNDMAKQFYAALGYQLVGRMNAYYDSQEAAVVMEKSLAVC
jgi:ribosomal-protein-alanine N-acetyltransferase